MQKSGHRTEIKKNGKNEMVVVALALFLLLVFNIIKFAESSCVKRPVCVCLCANCFCRLSAFTYGLHKNHDARKYSITKFLSARFYFILFFFLVLPSDVSFCPINSLVAFNFVFFGSLPNVWWITHRKCVFSSWLQNSKCARYNTAAVCYAYRMEDGLRSKSKFSFFLSANCSEY